MSTMLLGAGVALLVAVVVLLLVVLTRLAHLDLSRPVLARLEAVEKGQERGERAVREEIAKNRDEMTTQAKYLREEVGASVKGAGDSLVKSVAEISTVQQTQLDAFATQLGKLTETNRTAAKELREEIAACVKALTDSVVASMKETAELQKDQLEIFGQRLQALTQTTEQKLDGIRESATESAQRAREEIASSLHGFNESIVKSTGEIAALQKSELEGFSKQLATLMESSEKKHDALRRVVEERLRLLQTDNAVKLDQMRQTVDEKLQGTLEKRLGESFALVSDRLEKVHQGLGEMQTLAMGVGDLKKMLSNVKTRGTWGEVQLGSLLDQVLTPDQFAANVATKDGSGERVEFAIKLPGRNDDGQEVVWLPIDAKCPQEDYHRLLDAREKAHADGVEAAGRDLETAIKTAARAISDKYLNPPKTTDFAIMFLPTEGLFAEVVRRPGLVEYLQREYRIVVAGPTTLAALLNSLQMGFRTLAIQKRSSEVWTILGAVKAEFGRFGEILGGVQKRLRQASDTIDTAVTKTRTIERKLRDVQELPAPDAERLLGIEQAVRNGPPQEDEPGGS